MELAKPYLSPRAGLALEGEVLHHLWQKSLVALQSLQIPLGVTASDQNGQFHALFGRDSLWTVLFALEVGNIHCNARTSPQDKKKYPDVISYHNWLHDLAATVLRGLAGLQGRVVNDVNDEQPGRIVHEYWDPVPRKMLLARWPVIEGRYYGAFDATFLYLITLAQVDRFFNDQALLEELWPSAEAAFQWMLHWSDLDEDGIVEYAKRNPEGFGLANQVWKDSGESVQPRDHTSLEHPLAWVEVQGYAWKAYAAYRTLAQKRGMLDSLREQEIQRRRDDLIKGIQRFWLKNEQFPAIVLDGKKTPIAVVSSNPGHLLWSQCLERVQAQRICERLMQPDMLTPWGVRTLSDRAYYYNPLKYHCGAVWPFDNAVIAAGMQKYGFHAEARQIAAAVLQAVLAFEGPVELYTVQPSRWLRSHHIEQDWFLADYFSASSVQAWTAAAIVYLTTMLM